MVEREGPEPGPASGSGGAGVLATAFFENDWVRVRAATAAYAVLGILELVALSRYGGHVSWASPSASIYLAFVLSVLFAGGYG